jgi:hypothetical protein
LNAPRTSEHTARVYASATSAACTHCTRNDPRQRQHRTRRQRSSDTGASGPGSTGRSGRPRRAGRSGRAAAAPPAGSDCPPRPRRVGARPPPSACCTANRTCRRADSSRRRGALDRAREYTPTDDANTSAGTRPARRRPPRCASRSRCCAAASAAAGWAGSARRGAPPRRRRGTRSTRSAVGPTVAGHPARGVVRRAGRRRPARHADDLVHLGPSASRRSSAVPTFPLAPTTTTRTDRRLPTAGLVSRAHVRTDN